MKPFVLALAAALLLQLSATAQSTTETYVYDGLNRSYILYLPDDLPAQAPLVLLLHGYTSSAASVQSSYGMNAIADANGFAVCYPQGTQDESNTNFWNIDFPNENVDDVGFLSNLAQDLAAIHNLDAACTYVCGMSNGGMMSYYLGCERPDVFSAFASVTGTVTSNFVQSCLPNITVPFMQVHGTSDFVVPYDGGSPAAATFGEFIGVERVMRKWAKANSCNSVNYTDVPNSSANDFSTVELAEISGCNNGLKSRFYKVEGGGHTWPGSPSAGFFDFFNPTNQDINASAEIWSFFNSICAPSGAGIAPLADNFGASMFPNPASDHLNIMLTGSLEAQVTVVSLDGKLVLQDQLREGLNRIAIQSLARGFYVVEINNGLERIGQKLIVD
jgi:polyhydroxybutyrate depolymerase